MNKPDFKEWADNILDRSELVEALEKAYVQGYRDAEDGWWQAIDNDMEAYLEEIHNAEES